MDALRNVELTVVQLASDGYELAGKKISRLHKVGAASRCPPP